MNEYLCSFVVLFLNLDFVHKGITYKPKLMVDQLVGIWNTRDMLHFVCTPGKCVASLTKSQRCSWKVRAVGKCSLPQGIVCSGVAKVGSVHLCTMPRSGHPHQTRNLQNCGAQAWFLWQKDQNTTGTKSMFVRWDVQHVHITACGATHGICQDPSILLVSSSPS